MDADSLRQAFYWLILLLNTMALCVLLAWPRVKGKAWLIAFLSTAVCSGLYFRLVYIIVHHTADEPRLRI